MRVGEVNPFTGCEKMIVSGNRMGRPVQLSGSGFWIWLESLVGEMKSTAFFFMITENTPSS